MFILLVIVALHLIGLSVLLIVTFIIIGLIVFIIVTTQQVHFGSPFVHHFLLQDGRYERIGNST
jgi:hypothetical protein